MNLTTNNRKNKKMGLSKQTLEKTQACKNINTK